MKKGKKCLIMSLVFLLVFLIGVGSGVLARDGSEKIDVYYRNIKLLVNGVNVPAIGDNEPFIYGGRTFVPLRLVSEALGYSVNWDSANYTVVIGDSKGQAPTPAPTSHNLIDILPPYTVTGTVSVKFYPTTAMGSIKMGGTEYKNSLSIAVGAAPHSAFFNLGSKYKSLKGIIGTLDNVTRDAIIKFIADGSLIKTIEVKGGTLPQNFELNTTNVRELKIEHIGANGGTVGLAQLVLTSDPTAQVSQPAPVPASQRLIDILPPYNITGTVSVKYYPTTSTGSLKLGGITYKNSLSIAVGAAAHSASFNLNGKYKTLTGIIGNLDNVSKDAIVNIFADGSVIKTIEISGGALPQSFSINVTNVNDLKIEHVGNNGGTVGLAELNIK